MTPKDRNVYNRLGQGEIMKRHKCKPAKLGYHYATKFFKKLRFGGRTYMPLFITGPIKTEGSKKLSMTRIKNRCTKLARRLELISGRR